MNDLTRKRLDDLAKALADVCPERLSSIVRKSARLNIRLTESEKASIELVAGTVGLSVSEYLIALHTIAAQRMGPSPGK